LIPFSDRKRKYRFLPKKRIFKARENPFFESNFSLKLALYKLIDLAVKNRAFLKNLLEPGSGRKEREARIKG
jgi:hypothetical protein